MFDAEMQKCRDIVTGLASHPPQDSAVILLLILDLIAQLDQRIDALENPAPQG